MRKRASKRRWKRRCAIGRLIPHMAIVEHRLALWFEFHLVSINADLYTAKQINEKKPEPLGPGSLAPREGEEPLARSAGAKLVITPCSLSSYKSAPLTSCIVAAVLLS